VLTPAISLAEIDRRIEFHNADEIMEVSFEGLSFENSADVNIFYDRVEERIASTGESLWFFLVNYGNTKIDSSAWFAFSRRGKALNLAHSMGSVRFDASDITREQIERSAGTERFDPNLFLDRDSAIERLRSMASKRQKVVPHLQPTNVDPADLKSRIEFFPQEDIMEVDFSNLTFEHSRDVDVVYDCIEEKISGTGKKWYFLVNYDEARIQSAAWVRYAARGKTLNENWSLGSVRYAPNSETEADIRLRAESGGFRPNIRNTRKEALERLAEMKTAAETNRAEGVLGEVRLETAQDAD
jgi:hypothetical protein